VEAEGEEEDGEETLKQKAAQLKKEMVDDIIKASLALLYAGHATEPHLMAILAAMRVGAEEGRKRVSSSIRRLLYDIGLVADEKPMQTSRALLDTYVATIPASLVTDLDTAKSQIHMFVQVRQRLVYMVSMRKSKETANLTRLLNAAIPMLCHPNIIRLPDALGLLDALHISKHLCEKRILGKVAQETLRLLRNAQASAVKRPEEKQVEAQEQAQAEKAEEGTSDPISEKQDPDHEVVAVEVVDGDRASQDKGQEQELITPTEIVQWMSAPMSRATDYADHISEYKRPLAKLAKIVLPAVCGYARRRADGTVATNILARFGVGVEESAKMFGTVDSKEVHAAVELPSSDTNVETEAQSESPGTKQ
jgi:hypothetical protein